MEEPEWLRSAGSGVRNSKPSTLNMEFMDGFPLNVVSQTSEH